MFKSVSFTQQLPVFPQSHFKDKERRLDLSKWPVAHLKLRLVSARLGTRTQGCLIHQTGYFAATGFPNLQPGRREAIKPGTWFPLCLPSLLALMSAAQGAHVSGLFTVFLLLKLGPLLSQARHLPRTFLWWFKGNCHILELRVRCR